VSTEKNLKIRRPIEKKKREGGGELHLSPGEYLYDEDIDVRKKRRAASLGVGDTSPRAVQKKNPSTKEERGEL